MFISVPFINTLNKWTCSYSPLLHLNLNAVMCKINSINLAAWEASRNPGWLVMQIKELRGFHCPTHFSQNFAVLPALEFSCSAAGYSPAVEQAEPWHVVGSNLGFQVQWSSKISGGVKANSSFPSASTRAALGTEVIEQWFPTWKCPFYFATLPKFCLYSVSLEWALD